MGNDDQITVGMLANTVVDQLFRRVLADPALAPDFDGAEAHRLAAQQRAFLGAVLTGGQPHAAPVTAGLGKEARVAAHLAAALSDVGVPDETVEAILTAARHSTAKIAYLSQPVQAYTVPELPSAQGAVDVA